MRLGRRKAIGYAVVAATGLVIVLIVLIGFGYLALPSKSPAPVTIAESQFTILEGKNASGGYWFGFNQANLTIVNADQYNYSGLNGYPTTVQPGATFGVVVVLWNHDAQNHTVYSVDVSPPFTYVNSDPAIPVSVPAGYDSAGFTFTVQAPNDAGASLTLVMTINALLPPP